jgi:type I restriction enzyme M protein
MLTGELRNQIDRIWDTFWSGGISNLAEEERLYDD